ncbi:GNAT family N-acetyltransferase [Leptolyngbya sp. Cla-17]|uniref:GNAT family N-acetyltransferase n=1 Tax=Leptolyngbya sp. Cla-17 TaxID=2803751 RepID=UPI00184BDBDE|nr:GNAT family N-acetyltransferase [Leptolyngbya sp. Cla-17]
MSIPPIEYLPDATVDALLDEDLRKLLCLCFTKPCDAVFKERRYFHEPPSHRWLMRDEAAMAIAHIAVHEKYVVVDNAKYPIGGIAEVCVHPDHRGNGYAKQILAAIDVWLLSQRVEYAVLFGNPKIYASSGYHQVTNLFHDAVDSEGKPYFESSKAMVKPLTNQNWFTSEAYLPGLAF